MVLVQCYQMWYSLEYWSSQTSEIGCYVILILLKMILRAVVFGFYWLIALSFGVRVYLTAVQCARACQMLEDGHTQRQVAAVMGVSQSNVRRVWQRYQETGGYSRRPATGRPRSTSAGDDRYIRLLVRRNPFHTARRVNNEFRRTTGVTISDSTIRNRNHAGGLHARRPLVVPRLTDVHRRRRREWATEHRGWTINQWTQVLFTDESRFTVDHNDGRIRVWRGRNERRNPAFVQEHDRWGRGSVMVWAGISMLYRTELHVVQGNVNAVYYRDNILEPIVVPMAVRMGQNFVLMDDNAPPHRARIISTFLEEQHIERMPWPAMSPDLNPIENVWSILDRRIRNRNNPINNVADLTTALREEWTALDQVVIRNCVSSMRRRCVECCNNGGHPTSY